MLKHIVMWQLKDQALGKSKAENMVLMKEKLMACANIVPGMIEFEVGLGGQGLEATYDVVLYSVFMDEKALQTYGVHPTHEAVKQFIGEVRSARQCIDYLV